MMPQQSIKVFAPATVANVACGFDILGFALDQPGDEVTISLTEGSDVTIEKIEGDEGRLPRDPSLNSASVSVRSLLAALQIKQGVSLSITKKMPLGSGLGSSAASAAGAVYGLNRLLGDPLPVEELVVHAMEGERAACGSAHADNVAPSLMGGFVLIRSYNPLDIVRIPVKMPYHCAVIKPHIEIMTQQARELLGGTVSLKSLVVQTGNLGGLIVGLMTDNHDLIGRSLVDVVAEPYRAKLIPGFSQMKKAALHAGALGCSISGSGPSIFALCTNAAIAEEAGAAMRQACSEEGMESSLYVTVVNFEGVREVR